MSDYVVAVDPGKITGVATWRRPEVAHVGDAEHDAFELEAGEAMPWLHRELSRPGSPDLVVCEGITINADTHKKSQDVLVSVEQIGIARYLCHLFGTRFVVQRPGERKFATDAKLRACGWWTKGPHDHPREASRHLMTRLCFEDAAVREWVEGKLAGR